MNLYVYIYNYIYIYYSYHIYYIHYITLYYHISVYVPYSPAENKGMVTFADPTFILPTGVSLRIWEIDNN